MPDKAVYLLVVEGFADWEPAHAVAELRRTGQHRVEVVGLTRDALTSGGDSVAFMTVADAQLVAYHQPSEATVLERARIVERLRGTDLGRSQPALAELATIAGQSYGCSERRSMISVSTPSAASSSAACSTDAPCSTRGA